MGTLVIISAEVMRSAGMVRTCIGVRFKTTVNLWESEAYKLWRTGGENKLDTYKTLPGEARRTCVLRPCTIMLRM